MKSTLALIIFALLSNVLSATVWYEISAEEMVRDADLVAVCEVVYYNPFRQAQKARDDRTILGWNRNIRIKLTKVLAGTENESDLMVDWVDYSSDENILTVLRRKTTAGQGKS